MRVLLFSFLTPFQYNFHIATIAASSCIMLDTSLVGSIMAYLQMHTRAFIQVLIRQRVIDSKYKEGISLLCEHFAAPITEVSPSD